MDNRRGEIKMSTYEAWAGQVIEKIRRKMARVSEKTRIKSHTPLMKREIMTTAPTTPKAGILTTD